MAKHHVTFNVPERRLGKADIEFIVKRDGKKFGRLRVSNGSVVWVPKNKEYGYKMTWVVFNKTMKEKGKDEK